MAPLKCLNVTFHDHSVKHILTVGSEVYVAVIIWSHGLLVRTDVFISKVAEWHILNTEAADVSGTPVPICLATWHHIPEGSAGSLCCRSASLVSSPYSTWRSLVEASWNTMANDQKPDFAFRRNGRVHLKRPGRQFSRLLAAEVCASAVVMQDTPCVPGSVKSTGYPLHPPVSLSLPLPCVTVCHHISTGF